MKKITHAFLRRYGACLEQRLLFKKLYPKGIEVCWECLQEAHRQGLEIDWMLQFVPYSEKRTIYASGWSPTRDSWRFSVRALRLIEKALLQAKPPAAGTS